MTVRVSPIFSVMTWSAVISVTSTVTVMSSWNRYIKCYEAKHHYELPSPTNAQFQHDSCVRLKELPSKLVSHAYLILRNMWDISCFAPLVTFGDFQQGFTNFLCLTWSAVISVTQLWQSCHPEVDMSKVMKQTCRYELPSPTNAQFQHDSCVRLNELPSNLVSYAYLILRNKWDISMFCTSDDFWWLLAGFHHFLCLTWSAVISVTHYDSQGFTNFLCLPDQQSQCNSTVTVMSSWSHYIKSYEAKHHYELPSPTNAHFWHDSCVGLEELPSKLVSHAYLISRNKQDISHFAPLVTFGDFQQGFTNFLFLPWSAVISVTQLWQSCHPEVDTSKVMKQNVTISFPVLQMHISNMTVVSGSNDLPSKLVSHAYLILKK